MKKLLLGLIVLLLVCLTGEYGKQYAHAYKSNIQKPSIGTSLKADLQRFDGQREVLSSKPYSPRSKKKHQLFEVPESCEEEESESISSKTHLEYTGVLIRCLYAQTHQYLFSYLRKVLPTGNHTFNTLSPELYLIIQVFRI